MRREAEGDFSGETQDSQRGYPEEGPPGADPSADDRPAEDSPPREAAKAPRKHDDQAAEADDGTATGNPRSAG